MTKQVQEVYSWYVILEDEQHTRIDEHTVPSFADVLHEQIKSLCLLSREDALSHRVFIPTGATPVFFRRRSLVLDPIQGTEQGRKTTHCIGWKQGENAIYLFVSEDGSTLLTDNLQAV